MLLQHDTVSIPARMVPQYLVKEALEKKKINNILFKTYGGIGDQICSEPTIRYAMKNFKGCEFSIATYYPELFQHLGAKKIFNLKKDKNRDFHEYFILDTFLDPGHIFWEFCCHMAMHCVDFSSICALRCQLPFNDRQIVLQPTPPTEPIALPPKHCLVHPGKHWVSKTFPKDWWDAVLYTLISCGVTPVIIGADTANAGTVNVDTTNCIDLRNKISLNDCIYYLQKATVLITNDSMPLHAAASGNAWIGAVCTTIHFDHVTHFREGQFGWRMKDFAKSNIIDYLGIQPKEEVLRVDVLDEAVLRSWLPDPNEIAEWAAGRFDANAR